MHALDTAARADYDETERLVAAELEGLCRDAAWLKSYAVAALALGKEALQASGVLCLWCVLAVLQQLPVC